MDIEIIKQAKAQCESEIRAIIVMFEKQSELVVERISLDRNFASIGFSAEVIIEMDVRLRD